MKRNATAVLAVILVAVAILPSAAAAEAIGATGPRAEIQIALCAPTDRIVHGLNLSPDGPPLSVWFFDDAALTLSGQGLRLRLRVADGRSELTLKVADQDCARLDRELVPLGEGKCEVDVYGEKTAGAVSLNRDLGAKSTNELLAGRMTPAEALSPAQIRYLREVLGAWPLPPGIRGLGPMEVRRYRTKGKLYDIDISQLPGGEQTAEISRKVPLADAARAMEVMAADLSRAGIARCADQSSQAVNKLRAMERQRSSSAR